MPEPVERRVAEAAKRTADLHVRLTRAELAQVERKAEAHDPPTVAAWVRDLIAGELKRERPASR